MFRTIQNSMLMYLARTSMLALFLSASPCLAQEIPADDESSEKSPSSGVLSRLFGSTTKKPSQPTPKPKVPAIPTAGKTNRSGFLVPLKSFTKAFRGPSESELTEEIEEAMPKMTAPRIPREPFRNLPRIQERRERSNSDIQIEQQPLDSTNDPNAPSTEPSMSTSGQSVPAPIIRSEQPSSPRESSTPKVRPSSPSTATKTNASPKDSSVKKSGPGSASTEVVIESNSSSRRTKQDILETETPFNTVSPRPSTSQTASKKRDPSIENPTTVLPKQVPSPKNLIDLGQSSVPPTAGKTSNNQLASNAKEFSPIQDSAVPSEFLTRPRSLPTLPPPSKAFEEPVIPKTKPTLPINSVKSTEIAKPIITENTLPSSTPTPTSKSIESAKTSREMLLPGVRVLVNGPDSMLINRDGSYEIIAKNEGKETLNGLAMRLAVPSHVTVGQVIVTSGATQPDNDQDGNAILWELEQIPAGGSTSIKVILQTAKPEHFALGVEWTIMSQTTELQIQVQQPQLALALEGPSEVDFGKPQMYRVRVRNPGNADAKAVSIALSADPYGSNQSDIGDIAAGGERVVEVELTFQQSGALPVKAMAICEASELKAESSIEVQVRQSELAASWFGPSEFYQGGVADYDVEITNSGSIAAVGTVCNVTLPAGVEVVSIPPGAVRNGSQIQWGVKKIDPNGKMSFPIRLALNTLGNNTITFNAESTSGGEAKAEFATNVDSIADLHLSVIDPSAPAPVGQPVVYEIVIYNRGKKAATNIEVIAQFSEGIEPIRLEGHSGSIVPGQAIFNSIQTIPANEKLVLKVIAEASKSGVHRFRAEVRCVGSDADLLGEESTRFLATGLKPERR
jgi:uncharacterized repeat protein (TIGR01451 family)